MATEISSLGVVCTWAMLVIAQMRLRAKALAGELERPAFRMPGAPYTNWATLGFLALGVVLMGFAGGSSQIAFYCIPVLVVVLAVGWQITSRRSGKRSLLAEAERVRGAAGFPHGVAEWQHALSCGTSPRPMTRSRGKHP